ncbi:MAG: cytochrome C oxidase subunit IV family protein [Dehalococcoidia bacterium]
MENPELLSGIPLLIIGIIGLVIAFGALGAPERAGASTGAVRVASAHPGPAEYVRIGIVLGVITAIEVALYYIDLSQNVLISVLIVLSAAKFLLVVLWFMHLKFDSRVFSTLFATGFVLVMLLFVVVLATLDGALV